GQTTLHVDWVMVRDVELKVRHRLVFIKSRSHDCLDAVCPFLRQAGRHAGTLVRLHGGIISNKFPSLRKEFPVWPVHRRRWPFLNAWRSAAALRPRPRT